MGRPGKFPLRVDTTGRWAAALGVLCMAQNSQSETRAQNQEVGQPQNSCICAGCWFCTNPALVGPRQSAIRENPCRDVAISRFAVRNFMGRGAARGGCSVPQSRDPRLPPRQRENALTRESWCGYTVSGADTLWLVADLNRRSKESAIQKLQLNSAGQRIPL